MSQKKKALFLAHRIPYPPDKGDKIRSWQLFRFLAERFSLYAGFFVDDPADQQHVPYLADFCAEVKAIPINPAMSRLLSLQGLLTGDPLTLSYYRRGEMSNWVEKVRQTGIDLEVAFSSSVAPYLNATTNPVIVDLVDADSAKWAEYAEVKKFPLSWIYKREARKLAQTEAEISCSASATFLITDEEAALVKAHAEADEKKIFSYLNGVDAGYFRPDADFTLLDDPAEVVFTGAMDYEPNAAAVLWFAREVWPTLKEQNPDLRFAVVGTRPGKKIRALAETPGITVTGRVDDIRPWIAGAKVAVAPLQIARGLQNKVLEAMAMAKPVVASTGALTGLNIVPGEQALLADSPGEVCQSIMTLLSDADLRRHVGQRARDLVESEYTWVPQLARVEEKLNELLQG